MNYLKLSETICPGTVDPPGHLEPGPSSIPDFPVGRSRPSGPGRVWKTKQTKHSPTPAPCRSEAPWRLFQARSQHAVASRLNGLFYTGYTQQLYPKKWKLLVHFKSLACHLRVTCKSLASDAEGLLYLAAGLHTGFKDTNHGLRRKEETEESTGIPWIS